MLKCWPLTQSCWGKPDRPEGETGELSLITGGWKQTVHGKETVVEYYEIKTQTLVQKRGKKTFKTKKEPNAYTKKCKHKFVMSFTLVGEFGDWTNGKGEHTEHHLVSLTVDWSPLSLLRERSPPFPRFSVVILCHVWLSTLLFRHSLAIMGTLGTAS